MLSLTILLALSAPAEEPIYPDKAPGAVGTTAADKPTLTAVLPAKGKATGAAVVICPGGGYGAVMMSYEGVDVAKWFADRGVAGFVLRYRLAPRYKHPIPLQDVQRAIRFVKSRAKKYGIDPEKVGVMGFSAGGHLASCAATIHAKGDPDAKDPVERLSSRPSFAVLAYPVITLQGRAAHAGSAKNLLGAKPDAKLLESMSTQNRVSKDTPPTFLFHTKEDTVVPIANSELFKAACEKAGVKCKLVVIEKGRHGVGLGGKDPVLSKWPGQMFDWLVEQKLVAPAPK
jgi:acetyl esterase/lipase